MTRQQALKQLRSTTCVCTNRKSAGKSVCRDCYDRLPEETRAALYRPIGEGYAEAYQAALKRLGMADLPATAIAPGFVWGGLPLAWVDGIDGLLLCGVAIGLALVALSFIRPRRPRD